MVHRVAWFVFSVTVPAVALTPAPKPLVFGGARPVAPRARGSSAGANPLQALGGLGGAAGGGAAADGKAGPDMKAFRHSLDRTNLDPGDGSMEPCGTLPAQVEKDRAEMIAFRKDCPVAAKSGTQRMAINDYSCLSGAPKMYLFDADGVCQKKMSASFGNGSGREAGSGCPKACSQGNEHFTPPGFHLTVTHNGATYNASNSLGLAGLEGQGSKARAILIHGSNTPGTACSWGCTGVSHANLKAVMAYLGTGALVYNAFQPNQLAANCGNSAGMTHGAASACRMDPGAAAPAGGGPAGGGSGATSMLERVRDRLSFLTGSYRRR